jgi:hypothetical protein
VKDENGDLLAESQNILNRGGTLYPHKLAITSPTSGGRSVGIVRSRTQTMEFSFFRWKNYFSQLLNVHNVSDVRQVDVHTAELFIPGPCPIDAEIAIPYLNINRQVLIKHRQY